MTHRNARRKPKGIRQVWARVAVGVGAGVLTTSVLTTPVVGATPVSATAPVVRCTSAQAGLAERLLRDITAALTGREGTIAVGVYDRATGTRCTLRASNAYDSASVVKVTALAALLWDAKQHDRYLTDREASLARAMITKSDNAATRTLWKQLGRTRIKGFLTAADMTRTRLDGHGHWGLTQINVTDEQRLLGLVTAGNPVLSDNARAYILKLMGDVVPSQRWGTPYGAPTGVSVAVKNGWLSRSTHGWRVHSVGAFRGRGHDYLITVLTHDNRTMDYGIQTIQRVAQAVHTGLTAS